MKSKHHKTACAWIAVLMAFVLVSPQASACGPFFDNAVFSYALHPDVPFTLYLKGQLGVVEPTWARSYLVVAYRYLTNAPLSPGEQSGCMQLWNRRMGLDGSGGYQSEPSGDMKGWFKVRSEVTSSKDPDIDIYSSTSYDKDSYGSYENCSNEAFGTAAATLRDRIAKYGASSAYVQEWVKGQDLVFCHCGGRKYDWQTSTFSAEPLFPPALAANSDPLLKADRDYQIAAAHFYAKDFDQSAREFLAISQDSQSPWRNLGLYLAARSYIRKGTLANPIDRAALAQGEALLKQVLANNQLSSLHRVVTALLGFVEPKAKPESSLHELARKLMQPGNGANMYNNLDDYTTLLDSYAPNNEDGANQSASKPLSPVAHGDDLSDWIVAFQTQTDEATQHSLKRWKETHSLPWLISALAHANSGSTQQASLLAAAQALPANSPAYLTASYHAARILLDSNDRQQAGVIVEKAVAQQMGPSAKNDFLSQKQLLAKTIQTYMQLAARSPADYCVDYDGNELSEDALKVIAGNQYFRAAPCFEDNAANVLNFRTPLTLLQQAALVASVPKTPRFDFVQSVFTRAFLLGRESASVQVASTLRALQPSMAPLIDRYVQAGNSEDRGFAAAYMILKNPGMRPYVTPGAAREVPFGRIEDYGDNWWSSVGLKSPTAPVTDATLLDAKTRPSFLSAVDEQKGVSEYKSLKAMGEAPTILATKVLAYAKKHLSDARVPEALSLCVKASRFGSKDSTTSSLSKQAFQLLHSNFKGSAWTKKTPYHY